jgi:phage shock protein C
MTIYCRNCGKELGAEARFCPACGTAVYIAPPPVYPPASRLVRPRAGRTVAGVCQGLANAYVWDVTWVRVITVLLTVFGGGMGLIAYVIFWIVMPEEPLALPPGSPYPPRGTSPGNVAGGQ